MLDLAERAFNLAQAAQAAADEAKAEIKSHEKICELTLDGIKTDTRATNKSIGEIKKILAWGGITILAAIISTLGWSLKTQYDGASAQMQALQTEVQILRVQHAAAPTP